MASPIVFFDIGASLVQGPALTPARFLAQRLGFDAAQRKRLDHHLLTTDITTPAALADVLTEGYGAAHDQAGPAAAAAWETQMHGPAVIEGARDCLAQLRRRRVRYGFISNIWHPYADSFARLFGVLAEGDVAVYSYRLGIAKPDLALYRYALAQAGCRPEECTMVGDSYDNDMAPAIALGMRTVWLLHRPDKEHTYIHNVEQGVLPQPDLTISSIADMTAAEFNFSPLPAPTWRHHATAAS